MSFDELMMVQKEIERLQAKQAAGRLDYQDLKALELLISMRSELRGEPPVVKQSAVEGLSEAQVVKLLREFSKPTKSSKPSKQKSAAKRKPA